MKKVNPYQKKHIKKRRISKKQWIGIASLLCVVALILGITVAGTLSKATITDEHAGHDHSEDGSSANGEHYEGDGHNHGSSSGSSGDSAISSVLNHRVYTNADKTYRMQIVDQKNNVLFEKDKLANAPLKEAVKGDVYTLGWATGTGANDYEHVFCNGKTGEVSQLFYAPRGFDGVRVAYASADQTKIIVQDIFNKDAYYKEYTLENAYVGGDYVIAGGKLQSDNNSVLITYVVDESGKTRHATFKLYE